jgi:hypothetical protein
MQQGWDHLYMQGVSATQAGYNRWQGHSVIKSFTPHPVQVEVIGALTRIRVECAKVLKMSLFNTYYTKSSRLDEFEQSQSQNTDQVNGCVGLQVMQGTGQTTGTSQKKCQHDDENPPPCCLIDAAWSCILFQWL